MMSHDALSDAKLTRSAGFLQHDYLPQGATVRERVIYSALPGIVLSSTEKTATQGRLISIDSTLNTSVYADLVYVIGKIVAPGCNIKIVARKLVFVGDGVEIVTDGIPGSPAASTTANDKPQRAVDGIPARVMRSENSSDPGRDAVNGTPGLKADALDDKGRPLIADGATGGNGNAAGTIEINVEKWVGACLLSARGGDGGGAQDGQDGQDGGDGGDGVDGKVYADSGLSTSTTPTRDLHPPAAGGVGGDAGLGGAGGAGGNAGTVTVRAVRAFRCECQTTEAHPGCAGSVNSLECTACHALGAADLTTLATLISTGGALGKHGKNGVPGIGGLEGQTVGSDLRSPIGLEIIHKSDNDVRHGSRIGLKSTEALLGTQQVLGVYGNGVYYWDDSFDTDKQSWKIERIDGVGDGNIRYGDRVRLTNCSYQTHLIAQDGYLNAGASADTWVLESPTSERGGTVIAIGDRVILNHGGGYCVSDAYGGASYWFASVRQTPPLRRRAVSGTVRRKPAGGDPLTEHTKGKDEVSASSIILPAELCDHWDPAQIWLQVARLKGQYLTLDLGGASYADFGNELLRWSSLLAPLLSDKPSVSGAPRQSGPQARTGPQVQELLGAYGKISAMLGMYSHKYDFFGNMLNFSPNPSFPYYANELDKTLADLKAFDDHYSKLFGEAVSNDTFKMAAAAAFNEATATVVVAKARLETYKIELLDAQNALKAANAWVEELKTPFSVGQPDVQHFKDDIASGQFNCDLTQLLQGLEMMVFAPPVETSKDAKGKAQRGMSGAGVAMMGVQLAKFITYGVDTIKTVDGETLERKNVLTSVEQLDGELFASAQSIFTKSRGEKVDIGGPGILATLDEWEKLVEQFINLPSANALEHDIRALADAVRVRGEAITDFNAKLMNVLLMADVITDNDATRTTSLAAMADLNNPGIPAVLSFLTRHQQARKDAAIELVYLANRSYANWILDDGTARIPAKNGSTHDTNVFREVIVSAPPWANTDADVYGAIDWAVLLLCKNKLQDWFREDIGTHSGDPQPFGSTEKSGLVINVAGDEVLNAFRTLRRHGKKKNVHKIAVTITEHGEAGTFHNEHLKGLWDIRLTAFRVFLKGAFRAPGHGDERIQIQFIHDSSDQYFTKDGGKRTFRRPALEPRTFIYNGAKDAERYVRDAQDNETNLFVPAYIEMDGLMGSATPINVMTNDGNAKYAGVGPFTLWTIIVDPAMNPGLDLTGLNSIEIQLVGMARTRVS